MSFTAYAQNLEDVLLWRALGQVENGCYVDVGAQDPIVDSVSRGFYEKGWRGIHVEPVSSFVERLRRDRPDEEVVCAAVGDAEGEIPFFEFPETGLSTAVGEVADQAIQSGWTPREISVETTSLDAILAKAGERPIHWLKIDVEGFERSAITSWRTAPQRPWVILVEAITPIACLESFAEWEPLILAKGYTFRYFDGLNRYYVWDDKPDLASKFGYGPNVFDDYQLPESSRCVRRLVEERDLNALALRRELKATRAEADLLRSCIARATAGLVNAQMALTDAVSIETTNVAPLLPSGGKRAGITADAKGRTPPAAAKFAEPALSDDNQGRTTQTEESSSRRTRRRRSDPTRKRENARKGRPVADTPRRLLSAFGRVVSGLNSHVGPRVIEGRTPIFCTNGSQIGYILYGPYASLERGRYEGTILVRLDEPVPDGEGDAVVAAIDLAWNGNTAAGEHLVRLADLAPGEFKPFSVPFSLGESTQTWEMRLFCKAPIRLSAVALVAVRPID